MRALDIILLPLLCVFVTVFLVFIRILSTLEKSLRVRRRYVQWIRKIFEYADDEVERAYQLKNNLRKETQEEIPDWILRKGRGYSLVSNTDLEEAFDLSDIFGFVHNGIEAIVEDQVTQRFASEEPESWNLLTRSMKEWEFISWRLSFIWLAGVIIRYCILAPIRITILVLGLVLLIVFTALIGSIPKSYPKLRQKLYKIIHLEVFDFLSWCVSAVINFHNVENRPGVTRLDKDGKKMEKVGGICVANHTSPLDVLILSVDQCYGLVGQKHGGFLGITQRALTRACSHIWFERSELKDRESVAVRLKEHVEDNSNFPILIFPEGTCINNSAVMQFKKGSFEIGSVIYPVAIKYDQRFGDPFWDSSIYSALHCAWMLVTSWAIVCDVWYLPPMYRGDDESSMEFANRVKSQIAKQGGLVDLHWDGRLKRVPAKQEWKQQQQLTYYSRRFVRFLPPTRS